MKVWINESSRHARTKLALFKQKCYTTILRLEFTAELKINVGMNKKLPRLKEEKETIEKRSYESKEQFHTSIQHSMFITR